MFNNYLATIMGKKLNNMTTRKFLDKVIIINILLMFVCVVFATLSSGDICEGWITGVQISVISLLLTGIFSTI